MDVKGNIRVLGKGDFGRRANQGLITKSLSASETLTSISHYWQRFTLTGAQDVILPDATSLDNGWEVVIHNADDSDTLTVKDGSNTVLQTISAGKAYTFTLVDNTTSAGVWYITVLPQTELLPADRFSISFNATTSWTDAGTIFTYTVLASTHGKGTTPAYVIQELSGTDYKDVICQDVTVNSSGDITLSVAKTPDCRFAGRIIVL